MSFLKSRYESIRSGAEIADIGFFLLRIVALAGAIAWLVATRASRETVATFLWISLFFVAYGLLIYALTIGELNLILKAKRGQLAGISA